MADENKVVVAAKPDNLDSSYVKEAYTNNIPSTLQAGGDNHLLITVDENHFLCNLLGNKHYALDKNGDQSSLQGTVAPRLSDGVVDLTNPANNKKVKLHVSRGCCRNDYFLQDADGNVVARSKEPTIVQRLKNLFAGPFFGYTILTGVDAKDVERFVIRIPGRIECPKLCAPACKMLCNCDFKGCALECKTSCTNCMVDCKAKCVTCVPDCKAKCEKCIPDCQAKCKTCIPDCKVKCEKCVLDCKLKCEKCKLACVDCALPFHEELLLWRPWDLEPSHWVTKIEFDGHLNGCGQVIPGYTIKVNFPADCDVVDRAVLAALAFYCDYHILSHAPTLYPPHLLHKKK